MTPKIKTKECRFATYVPPPEPGAPDLLVIKEQVHYDDGTIKPNINLIYNFKRPFWVTKKGFQNHQQKKEWEDVDKLIKYDCRQADIIDHAAKALGKPWFKGSLRDLSESVYLYGSDITSTAVIKRAYQDKYKDIKTKYSVGVFDTETDVIEGTEEIVMASFTFKSICHTAVVGKFLSGITDIQNRVDKAMDKYLGQYVESRKLICTLDVVENPLQAIISCINKAHEHKPDFLAIWNIDFDVTKVLNICDKYGCDPADIFSDPIVPREFRYFKYKQGKKQKVTASGKVTPIKPAAQWHVVTTPASFTMIDAMCVYKHVRIGKPEEQSYALDAILAANLEGVRKLTFVEADHVQKLKWHQLMQSNYKIEYIIYNRFDCISMEILDEKTKDLSLSLPLFSGCSDFANFNSQPRRTVDRLHYYVMEKGKIIASTSSEMEVDIDDEFDLTGWITTLPAALIIGNGLKLIEEYPDLATNLYSNVGDLDVSASYPNGECTLNISKETTKKELITVEGIDEKVMKMQGINLSGAQTNASEFCQTVLNYPDFFTLLDVFNQQFTE